MAARDAARRRPALGSKRSDASPQHPVVPRVLARLEVQRPRVVRAVVELADGELLAALAAREEV